MKTLYLVRHAKSSWDYPNLPDHDRPLNNRGQRDAPEMGRRLAKRGISPDLLLSSTANRALTTCQEIARAIGYKAKGIISTGDIYHAGPNELMTVLRSVDNKHGSVMMFGHNPGFTDFANELADTDIYNIPTCGVFACSFDLDKWEYIDWSAGTMLFYDYPKNKE